MLPARERLTRSSLFSRAYTTRKSVGNQLLTVYVLPRTSAKSRNRGKESANPKEFALNRSSLHPVDKMPLVRMPLAGFVIAKKVCKSACRRNRAKRRVREAYRLLRNEDQALFTRLEQWYAIVFVMHEKVLAASWNEVRDAVRDGLKRINDKYGLVR
ncbi:MAG TPA: ribonuclease P protein component [Chroococcales cyanobacterium]